MSGHHDGDRGSPLQPTGLKPALYSVVDITRPDPRLLGLYALRTLALCLLGPWFVVALVPLYFKYRTLRYRFDDEGITTSWGLLWRREIHLTYARIQDIHLSRGVLERWLGLATIHVQTASGNAGAEMSLVGLTEHGLIRDFLYSRMRGADEPLLDDPGPGRGPTAAAHARQDETLRLLRQVLDEARRLRRALETRPAAAPPSADGDDGSTGAGE